MGAGSIGQGGTRVTPVRGSDSVVLLVEAGPDFRSADAPDEMREASARQILRRGGYRRPRFVARLTAGAAAAGTNSVTLLNAERKDP